MSNYQQLQQHCDRNDMEMTYVISPMRTLSTVFLPWAAPLFDEWLSEPLHPFGCKDFDDGCRNIVDKTEAAITAHTDTRPVQIMAKDMSHIVTPEIFDQLMPITKNFVFTIREPYLQATSSIRQFSIDLKKDAKNVTADETDIKRQAEAMFIQFNQPAYEQMGTYINALSSSQNKKPKGIALIEACGLKLHPDDTFMELAKKLGLRHRGDHMTGWDSLSADKFVSNRGKSKGTETPISHWNARAAASTKIDGINPADDTPPSPSSFSPEVVTFIRECALPHYMRFLLNQHLIGLPSFKDLDSPLPGRDERLEDINPIAAYAIAKALLLRADSSNKPKLDSILHRIRNNHQEYAEDLKILDKATGEYIETLLPQYSIPRAK